MGLNPSQPNGLEWTVTSVLGGDVHEISTISIEIAANHERSTNQRYICTYMGSTAAATDGSEQITNIRTHQ
jgi:hypothetical protein